MPKVALKNSCLKKPRKTFSHASAFTNKMNSTACNFIKPLKTTFSTHRWMVVSYVKHFKTPSKSCHSKIWHQCAHKSWIDYGSGLNITSHLFYLALSWRRSLSYRNHLLCKSMDWLLYDRVLCHERVKQVLIKVFFIAIANFPKLSFHQFN